MKRLILGLVGAVMVCGVAAAQLVATVANVTLTNAGTEYSLAVPTGASAVTIQSRTAADFKLATASGASGTTYLTIKSGTAYYESNVSAYHQTLYFQSANAGQVIEVIYWK